MVTNHIGRCSTPSLRRRKVCRGRTWFEWKEPIIGRTISIVSTHDFFGSFAPLPTSYGVLPGGEGLRDFVGALRKSRTVLWADTGDLTQSGPLSSLTNGVGGFRAASELGIDVGVVGNHDLDFGETLLRTEAPGMGFPLLCANASLGLAASRIIETRDGAIGFVGLTHPDLASMTQFSLNPSRSMPEQFDESRSCIAREVAELRRLGAEKVVAIVHDGLGSRMADGKATMDGAGLAAWCQPWLGQVDLLLCGHTLGRYFGHLKSTPISQPWPFGTEVGVTELNMSSNSERPLPHGILVGPGQQWSGYGRDILTEAAATVLGVLREPVDAVEYGQAPLAYLFARAVRSASGADLAYAYACCGQPIIDGRFAFLSAGAVTQLQILQLTPWTDHSIVICSVPIEVLPTIADLPQDSQTAWSEDGTMPTAGTVRLAVPAGFAQSAISKLVPHALNWKRSGASIFDGLKIVLDGQ